MWSLFSLVEAYGWRFASWIRVKTLSQEVARANGVDALGRHFLLRDAVVVKLSVIHLQLRPCGGPSMKDEDSPDRKSVV